MQPPNKVRDYYDTAVEFLSLPLSARFLIGTHFQILRDETLVFGNKDIMDETIFREVCKRGIYKEFKKFTAHFKKSRSHEYTLQ